MRKFVFRWPFISSIILLACGSAFLALNPQWIKVEAIELELVKSSDQDLLFQRIKTSLEPQFKSFEGRFFWQVPLSRLYDLVAKDKRVKRASIRREFPSRLRVEVEPRTPVLAYLARDGRVYPVATDATLLPALPFKDSSDLPLLRGEEFRDEQELRARAIELFEVVPDDGLISKAQVSEIGYSRKEGFKIFVSGSKAEVKMGDTDFGPKISRVQRVLSYLEMQSIKGRVIDARYAKKVVVRVRNTP
jgi:cell division septal protein FtsQ